MRNAYGGFDTKEIVDRPALINKLAKGYRRKGAAQLGLAGLGAASLLGGEDEEVPVGDAAAAVGGGGNVDPSTYAAPGYLIGSDAPQEFGAMTEDKMNPPGFFDNISNAGWMGIINAGLSLAAPQGDSQGFGQDLANAAKAGLGTFTEQTDSDLARTNDKLDRDIMREQALYDISQRGSNEAYMAARTAALGSTISAPHANKLATEFADSDDPQAEGMTRQDTADLQDSIMRYGPSEGLRLYRERRFGGSIPKHTDTDFMGSFKFGG
jgi:hypothetical protein